MIESEHVKCDCQNHYLELFRFDDRYEPYYIRMCYKCGNWWIRHKEYIKTGVVLYANGTPFCEACEEIWRDILLMKEDHSGRFQKE